jgi:hypothetical protein
VRGDLAETSHAALLTALGRARARGQLLIEGTAARGAIVLWDGQVVDARSPAPRARLADRLVRTGRLERGVAAADAELRDGTQDEAATLDALVRRGAVDADVLRQLRSEQVLDAVAELLAWRSGRYDLVPDPEDAPAPAPDRPRLPVELVLAQAGRRRARLDQLAELLPSLDVVPVTASDTPLTLDLGADPTALLTAIDGRRDLAALAAHLGLGGFEVLRLAAGLHALGLIDIAAAATSADAAAASTARRDDQDDRDDTVLFAAVPEPVAAVAPDAGRGNGQGEDDTDVAAFLRELSSLALGDEQPTRARPRQQADVDASAAGGGPGPRRDPPASSRPGTAPARRDPEAARRKRGLFGRG